MGMVQVGNGWLNTQTGKYTVYDPQSGQLITRGMKGDPRFIQDMLSKPEFIQSLQSDPNGISNYFGTGDPNFLGGRSNVNLSGQIGQAAGKLMQQYPQMTKESAMKYANQWVMDRIAHGQDANQIEDFAKGILRDDKNLGDEMFKGIVDMVGRDEFNATPDTATGADTQPKGDPRGSIQNELRAFAGRMMAVLPPDHPQVQRIAELAQVAGNKYATKSGMGPGGLTATGVGNTTARAMVDLQTQREGIGANALAAAGNQQLSVDQLNTQLQQMNQQAANSQAGGIGGLIGGATGLVAGGVATAFGANPQVIPGLMQGGSNYGAGTATLLSNGNQPNISYGGIGSAPSSTYKGRDWGVS